MANQPENRGSGYERFKDFPIDNQIKRALSEMGFTKPLEVQSLTIPMILEGRDLIVKSRTGSGKTAAFAIPICEQIDTDLEATQALVLAPTRELAVQVKEDIADIGRHKGIHCAAVYGKQPIDQQRRELKQRPHVIVATPGRMMDHLSRKNIHLDELKILVIDEADELLLMGFQQQLEAIITKAPHDRTTLMFSATMPEAVLTLSKMYMKDPQYLEAEAETVSTDQINQIYYAVDGLKKVDFMKKMLKHESPKKTVIFCNTQHQVDMLFDIMKKWRHRICAVHGGMEQSVRMGRLKGFKRGEYDILIATDVAARGIHVEGITHVINYGVPFDHENYVHRIGRTGRVDQSGIAITLVIPREMDRFKDLEKFLGYSIPCRGGHVTRKPKTDKHIQSKKGRYKDSAKHGGKAVVQIEAGRLNSQLKSGDILSAFKSVNNVSAQDIGRIEIRDRITRVTVYGGKETEILKAFKNKTIKGKQYRVKKG